MPLALDLTKDELWYCKLLAKGQVEFGEMDFDKKLLVYEANVKLTDVVDEQEIREFEGDLALKGYFGTKELAKAAGRKATRRITG